MNGYDLIKSSLAKKLLTPFSQILRNSSVFVTNRQRNDIFNILVL